MLAMVLAAAAWGTASGWISFAASVLGFLLTLSWTVGQLAMVWSLRTRGTKHAVASCRYIQASGISVVAMVSAVLAARSCSSATSNAAALLAFLPQNQQVLLPVNCGAEHGGAFSV
ncbi:hypothetical protein HYH03_008306 [Edaphochlamys debaryana]|uniref:Uncharacterized protein n=1 Tax=Edaphochlamys debaryana TaxID=47281 RepID=A0A835Y6S1_9CHLO|nr:hypothetical protein HYH03_008306 [Edaphochlamys debaryana]|eukprot:KAG2493490.1 hypothetical protein HYH03_008306 [Edaphochlamys debaryana]